MDAKTRAEKMANDLFDRLYGQPREDLDNREMKVICEWIEEAEREAVKTYLNARGEMPLVEQIQKLQALDLQRVNDRETYYAEGFRAGQLDAQYDNDTLPEQIAAYKRLAYEQGFNTARDKAKESK